MLEKLTEIYYELTGNYDVKITPKTKIKNELQLSSLGLVQLICAIEDEFNIKIPNDKIRSFKTVRDITEYLEKNTK